jgi:hypothetical protein
MTPAAFARRWPWWPHPFPIAGPGSRQSARPLPVMRGAAPSGRAPALPHAQETARA